MKATKFFALALAGLLAWGGVGCSSDDDPKVDEGKTKLSTPAPQATDITSSSFVATWPAVTGAGSYVYTVNDGAEKSVSTTSVLVDNLTASTAYTFKVKAVPANTDDFEESAWGSVNATTKEPAPEPIEYEYTPSFDYAEFDYWGEDVWTSGGVPIKAHNYVIDFYDFTNYQVLSVELQTATQAFEGTFEISDGLEAGTAVPGVVLDGYMYGTWFIPYNATATEIDWDLLTEVAAGGIQLSKNADGTYTVHAEFAGFCNIVNSESEEELNYAFIYADYSGAIVEAEDAEAATASVKHIVKPANYRKFAFADVNRVAGNFTRNVR
ncbi:MAG: fibronectin type III domain-containing protein [Alistipes sp.]|nr:fibronectin type III domain-containing protein [Alistipes sp.]